MSDEGMCTGPEVGWAGGLVLVPCDPSPVLLLQGPTHVQEAEDWLWGGRTGREKNSWACRMKSRCVLLGMTYMRYHRPHCWVSSHPG